MLISFLMTVAIALLTHCLCKIYPFHTIQFRFYTIPPPWRNLPGPSPRHHKCDLYHLLIIYHVLGPIHAIPNFHINPIRKVLKLSPFSSSKRESQVICSRSTRWWSQYSHRNNTVIIHIDLAFWQRLGHLWLERFFSFLTRSIIKMIIDVFFTFYWHLKILSPKCAP